MAADTEKGEELGTEAGRTKNKPDLFRLGGKTAVATGGGRGLGRYVAGAPVEAEANVEFCSRRSYACEEAKRELEGIGDGEVLTTGCEVADPDVAGPDGVSRVVEKTVGDFGKLLRYRTLPGFGEHAAEASRKACTKESSDEGESHRRVNR